MLRESVEVKSIYVASVVDVGLRNYIFVAFRIQLCALAERLTVRIAQTPTNLNVANWLFRGFAVDVSVYSTLCPIL